MHLAPFPAFSSVAAYRAVTTATATVVNSAPAKNHNGSGIWFTSSKSTRSTRCPSYNIYPG